MVVQVFNKAFWLITPKNCNNNNPQTNSFSIVNINFGYFFHYFSGVEQNFCAKRLGLENGGISDNQIQ